MRLCTSRVLDIPARYTGATLSYSKDGHRDAIVPLTEARTEMIHGQFKSAAPYPSGSRISISTILNGKFLCLLSKHGKIAERKIESKEHAVHETVVSRRKVTGHSLPDRVELLYLLRRCCPSLLSAPRHFHKLLASGELYSSCCFVVCPDVCLMRQ